MSRKCELGRMESKFDDEGVKRISRTKTPTQSYEQREDTSASSVIDSYKSSLYAVVILNQNRALIGGHRVVRRPHFTI